MFLCGWKNGQTADFVPLNAFCIASSRLPVLDPDPLAVSDVLPGSTFCLGPERFKVAWQNWVKWKTFCSVNKSSWIKELENITNTILDGLVFKCIEVSRTLRFSEWMPWTISALFLVYKNISLTLETSITIALESIKRHNLQHVRSQILMHMLDYKRN